MLSDINHKHKNWIRRENPLNKKIISSLITTLLIISILTIPQPAASAVNVTLTKEGKVVTKGYVGDTIEVSGTNPTPGGLVEIYWENLNPVNKLNSTYSKPSGYGYGTGTFECNITIPATVTDTYSIIVKDVESGETGIATFTVLPKLSLSPSTGLSGDTIEVEGTGFASEVEIEEFKMYNDTDTWIWTTNLTVAPSTIETDVNGSFTCSFTIPKDLAAGKYTVEAKDEEGNSGNATLTVGPSITISPTSGPTGTIVDITGRGFQKGATKNITITIDDTECPVIEEIKVRSDGRFSGKFVIPTVDEDEYTITASVFGMPDVNATADFEVTGTTGITLTPTSGAPGSTVTIEGVNFTAKSGVEITIDFGGLTEYATTETNATGGFLVAITVPSVPVQTEPYNITATDEYGLNATAEFRVALTTLAITPSSGPTGTKVLLMGGGLTPSTPYNVTIDGKLMLYTGELTSDPNGNIKSDTYVYVPTVPVGTYTITVMDEEGIMATATFEVTKTTEIVLDPSSAPRGYNVTFELNHFYHEAGVDIDLIIYNVTAEGEVDWETDLSLAVGANNFTTKLVQTNETGCFKGWFVVPASFALGGGFLQRC